MSSISKINNGLEIYKDSKETRDSNLELFRIITMILIVAHHYVVNSGLTSAGGPIYSNLWSFRSIFLLVLGAWGKTGINCFVLITGYFMCKSNITARKFTKLFCEIMFYRIIISMIFWISGYSIFTLKDLLKVLIPITSIDTDFTSTYIIFFLFIPFLNILVHNMSEKQHIYLLLLCSFLYIFLGTVPFFSVTMNYVSWFIVLYFISSYIRMYPKKNFKDIRFWGGMTIISVILSIISVIICIQWGIRTGQNMAFYFVTDSNTFLAISTALCSFMFFKNINIKYNKVINTIAASTFGVLLIHANSDTMRQWLWKDTLHNVDMYYLPTAYIHAIVSVLLIFLICTIIDYLRIKFIEIPFLKFWDKYSNIIVIKFNVIEEKVCIRLDINNNSLN